MLEKANTSPPFHTRKHLLPGSIVHAYLHRAITEIGHMKSLCFEFMKRINSKQRAAATHQSIWSLVSAQTSS